MGVKNYLIEGVSCTGKTTVCNELQKRGYHAIHGDRQLAYQGNPETGLPTDGIMHEHHIWDIQKVKDIVADQEHPVTFFCGGSRNFSKFIDLFDGVFILEIDSETLKRRLDKRPKFPAGRIFYACSRIHPPGRNAFYRDCGYSLLPEQRIPLCNVSGRIR